MQQSSEVNSAASKFHAEKGQKKQGGERVNKLTEQRNGACRS